MQTRTVKISLRLCTVFFLPSKRVRFVISCRVSPSRTSKPKTVRLTAVDDYLVTGWNVTDVCDSNETFNNRFENVGKNKHKPKYSHWIAFESLRIKNVILGTTNINVKEISVWVFFIHKSRPTRAHLGKRCLFIRFLVKLFVFSQNVIKFSDETRKLSCTLIQKTNLLFLVGKL